MQKLPPYATIEKRVGETPLEATERLRTDLDIANDIPLAYAGRLDPMASGTLLILIGDECKRQTDYHTLDKTYTFQILFGAQTDTGDALGIVTQKQTSIPLITKTALKDILRAFTGSITLPYPHFSSKTVSGKPLHVWTLEGRLNEIEIPTKDSEIYRMHLDALEEIATQTARTYILKKIETPTTVTAESKKLGANFRRDEVRSSWQAFFDSAEHASLQLATITCTASSGTYMRSLAEAVATRLGTCGLAYSIHRTHIGRYKKLFSTIGVWRKKF